MGGKGFCNQKNVFISVLGCVRIRKLVEIHDVVSHSGALVFSCSGKMLLQCPWDRAAGSSSLLPSGVFGCHSGCQCGSAGLCMSSPILLKCSWLGKAQKHFSTCIVKANSGTGNTWIAPYSQEVCNTSASSVCRFLNASSTQPCLGG